MERIPLHSWEMEFSIQYHVTINSQLNDQNSIRYYINPNEQNFDLDKSRQRFHHSLKEHHKISSIPKFRWEML
jgi:hypothetical protein